MSYLTDIGPLSAITIKSYYQANKAHKKKGPVHYIHRDPGGV